MRISLKSLALAASLTLACHAFAAATENLNGRWAATLETPAGVEIPFRLDISQEAGRVVGTLYNGREPKTTSSANIHDGRVELNFEHYLLSIRADVKDGALDGQIVSLRTANAAAPATKPRIAPMPFHAQRYVAPSAQAVQNVPRIGGVWEVAQETAKGEKAWRLIVEQQGADILATILRIDGDTGGLTGEWRDGKFVASHYDGARPGLIVLTPQPDGSLHLTLNATPHALELTAFRPEVARAKGLPEPSDFQTHTTIRDPNEVFAYNFPDVNGKLISNEDPLVKGKVVLAVVTGTWCPNCHDEAQYLVQLQKKYADQGLQILALDFEEEDQLQSLTRVKAFTKKYGVPYPYLIVGTPDQIAEKLPQAVNLNTWPATFFIGRDGRVRAVHSGFAAPASGPYHLALQEEFTSTIEKLLREEPSGSPAPVVTSARAGAHE